MVQTIKACGPRSLIPTHLCFIFIETTIPTQNVIARGGVSYLQQLTAKKAYKKNDQLPLISPLPDFDLDTCSAPPV
jgi:hypothetical protein